MLCKLFQTGGLDQFPVLYLRVSVKGLEDNRTFARVQRFGAWDSQRNPTRVARLVGTRPLLKVVDCEFTLRGVTKGLAVSLVHQLALQHVLDVRNEVGEVHLVVYVCRRLATFRDFDEIDAVVVVLALDERCGCLNSRRIEPLVRVHVLRREFAAVVGCNLHFATRFVSLFGIQLPSHKGLAQVSRPTWLNLIGIILEGVDKTINSSIGVYRGNDESFGLILPVFFNDLKIRLDDELKLVRRALPDFRSRQIFIELTSRKFIEVPRLEIVDLHTVPDQLGRSLAGNALNHTILVEGSLRANLHLVLRRDRSRARRSRRPSAC